MIKIDRDLTTPDLPVYMDARRKGADGTTKVTHYNQEKEKAVLFFSNPVHFANDQKITKKKNIDFKVYKDDKLVYLLKEIFRSKCAYCESDFGAVTPADVEHFRPKSAVKTATTEIKPGYYWLAGDWPNLLISCPDCNRSRTHKVPGQTDGIVLGKGTQFPLLDESKRIRSHTGIIDDEDPVRLLIDPCVENPEQYLRFDDEGNVHARKIDGIPSPKGTISIEVYALRRKALVEKRRRTMLDLAFTFEELTDLVLQNNSMRQISAPSNMLDRNTKSIKRNMRKLNEMFLKESEYLAAKRDWIRSRASGTAFNAIRNFGVEPLNLLAKIRT